jgi:hypothetical protein
MAGGMVGTFPGLASQKRKAIRAELNPMDKSTVVSIYPKPLREVKYTIQPGIFELPAGSYAKPSLLVVGSSSWWKDIDEMQPLLEIPNGSVQVAHAIVQDYCNGLLACNMNDHMPGLFWIPGAIDLKKLVEEHKNELDRARTKQTNWFTALLNLADGLWAASSGNPRVISDDMRMAARELNQTNKDWMKNFTIIDQVRCIACGSQRNPDYPVCPTCHAIVDPVKAKELNIKFAE